MHKVPTSAAAMLTLLLFGTLLNGWALAAPTFSLQSARKVGDIDRVVCKLELGGESIAKSDEGKTRRHKLSAVADFAYEEKTLQLPTRSAERSRSVRYYDKMEVVIKRDKKGHKPVLRPERRLIGSDLTPGKLIVFSPKGTLTHNELILIDTVANSILLDSFLPKKSVSVGDSWKHTKELIAPIFDLDSTSVVDVQSTLTEVTDTAARFEISGHIEGIYEGTPTKIDMKARYRFNRRTRRIDWFGLMAKEDRSIGRVVSGLDATVRFEMQIVPQRKSLHLTASALKGLTLSATPASTLLTYRSGDGGWEFISDRRWHIVADSRDLAHLKLLDGGRVLAQCSVSPLPWRDPSKMISLLEFQNDVRKALGKSCKEVVRAKQYANAADYRVYRVVCRGTAKSETAGEAGATGAQEVPIQWTYYYLANRHGRQAVFAFTVEQSLVGRLNKADEKLVQTLRFVERQAAKKEEK